MALFRMAFFRLFALIFRHFAWRISFFRLFAWRYFVFSLFRLAFFRYFVFSLGVISSWRRAITPGEKTKERNNEMAQTSHHMYFPFMCVRTTKALARLRGCSSEPLLLAGTMCWLILDRLVPVLLIILSYHVNLKKKISNQLKTSN